MMPLIDWMNAAGGGMLSWLAWMNAWTLIILVLVLALDLALARRVEPRWRVLLYGAIVVRLALPATLESPIGVWTFAADRPSVQVTPQRAPIVIHEMDFDLVGRPIDEAATAADVAAGATLQPAALVPIGWAGVSILLLMLWGIARWRLARRLHGAAPARPSIARLAPETRILEHSHLGPAVAGVLRPVIVLPRTLAEESEHDVNAQNTLNWIIRHESAHVARRDHLLAAGMQLLTILCWPVIALWIGAHRVRRLMEQACDDHALAGAGAAERRAYGETLLSMASRTPRAARTGTAALANIGLLGHAYSGLRGRLRALTGPARRRWPAAVQIAGLAALLPVLVAGASVQSAPPPPPAKSAPAPKADAAPPEIDVTIRVFRTWPKHPKTTFDIAQRSGDAPPPPADPDPKAHIMSSDEYGAYLVLIQENPGAYLITSPRVRTFSGQSASIRVGQDDEKDEAGEGLLLDVKPVLRPDGTLALDATYRAFGLPTQPPASRFEDGDEIRARLQQVALEDGETIFTLATGYIGAPMHLVAITVKVATGNPGNAAAAPGMSPQRAPADAPPFDPAGGVYPQIEYYALVHEFDEAPRLDIALPDTPHIELTLAESDGSFSAMSRAYILDAEQEKTLFEWLRQNGRGTEIGGKKGVAIAPPGKWSALHAAPTNAGRRVPTGFGLRFLGRVDGDRVVMAVVYEEETREQGEADPKEALVLPDGARLVGRLTIGKEQSCAIALPPSNRSPGRVIFLRASILRSVEDWPFQRSSAPVGAADRPAILNEVAEELLRGIDDQGGTPRVPLRLQPPPPPPGTPR